MGKKGSVSYLVLCFRLWNSTIFVQKSKFMMHINKEESNILITLVKQRQCLRSHYNVKNKAENRHQFWDTVMWYFDKNPVHSSPSFQTLQVPQDCKPHTYIEGNFLIQSILCSACTYDGQNSLCSSSTCTLDHRLEVRVLVYNRAIQPITIVLLLPVNCTAL